MICLVDCGATTCKVSCMTQGEWQRDSLPGFNPHVDAWGKIDEHWSSFFQRQALSEIWFYGAGLNSHELIDRMITRFAEWTRLSRESIHVFSDVIACAHAAYAGKPVLVGVLGTGSSIGYFDGRDLMSQTKSKSFPEGDEGSGADLGLRIYKRALTQGNGDLRQTVTTYLDDMHVLSTNLSVPTKENKALYAALTPVALIHEEECAADIEAAFDSYVTQRVTPEIQFHSDNVVLHLFGSVAFHFQSHVTRCMQKSFPDLELSFHQSPLGALEAKVENDHSPMEF